MSSILRFSALAMATALVLSACGEDSTSDSADDSSGSKAISVSLLNTTESFFKNVATGIEDEAADAGYSVTVTSADGDIAKQISQVENFITNQSEAVVLVPADSAGIAPGVQRANDAGLPVFTADIRAGGGDVVSHTAAAHREMGEIAATELCSALDGEGKVLLLSYPEVSSVQERDEGFQAAVDSDCPGLEVVDVVNVKADRDAARTAVERALAQNPDLGGIASTQGGDSAFGALQALEAASNTSVKVVAFDAYPEMRQALLDGQPNLIGDIASFGYTIGRETMKQVIAHLEGGEVVEDNPVPVIWVTKDELVQDGDVIYIVGHEDDEPNP